MRSVLVISPHLDDAVLSAGQFLAGRQDAIVATVLAGKPKDPLLQTAYDKTCGFTSSQEAVETRREEDHRALAYLGATAEHLEFLDSQYGTTDFDALTRVIRGLLDVHKPEMLIGPLGLVHPDHKMVRNAVLLAAHDFDGPAYLYEDMPSRVLYPEEVLEVRDELEDRGFQPHKEFIGDGPIARKILAVWQYRSQIQLPEFQNEHCYLVPERFWRV
jgi:LmbE family N-acetylglucosaminyl deacetylase